MQAFLCSFFLCVCVCVRAIRRSCSLALLAETVETGNKNHDVSDLIVCKRVL